MKPSGALLLTPPSRYAGAMLDETLLNAARAACEAQNVRELAEVATGPLRRALDAANVLMFSFGPQGLRGEGGELSPALSNYAAELFEGDIIQQAVLRAEHVATPTIPTQWRSVDFQAHKRSAAYADFYRPLDIEHFICVHLNELPYGSDGMRGILFCRSDRQAQFSRSDLARIASMAPFLRAAQERIQLLEQTQQRLDALEATVLQLSDRPLLLVGKRAHVRWISGEAKRWLCGRSSNPCSLPPQLVQATEALLERRQAVSPPLPSHACAPAWLQLAVGEGNLWAHLEPLSLADSQPAVLVRLTRHRPTPRPRVDREARNAEQRTPERAREIAGPDAARSVPFAGSAAERARSAMNTPHSSLTSLTRAEWEVLTLLRHGLNNRTIAERRSVSLETVRTHVRRILFKLGVENRSQAALFAQAWSRDEEARS